MLCCRLFLTATRGLPVSQCSRQLFYFTENDNFIGNLSRYSRRLLVQMWPSANHRCYSISSSRSKEFLYLKSIVAKENSKRTCSKLTESTKKDAHCPALPKGTNSQEKLTLGQRFKLAYRQYGKVLLGVHLVLSVMWYGSFYVIASSGFDVAGLLERWGFTNERISTTLRSSAGSAAVAYLLYKLASPVRYALTLGGTHVMVKVLRRFGYLQKAAVQAK